MELLDDLSNGHQCLIVNGNAQVFFSNVLNGTVERFDVPS